MKNINLYSLIMLGFVALFTTVFAYWLLWPYKPAVINSIVVEYPVERGAVLKYRVDYCKYMDVPATASRQLIDNAIIFFPEIHTNNPVGCDVGDRFLPLPTFAGPDKYVLRISTTYKVNPLREITVVGESNVFEIVGITTPELIEQVQNNTEDIEKLQ